MDRLALGQVDGTKGLDRRRLHVKGIVQGVGFRPLVFRLAAANQVNGYVCNQLGEVTIEVEGAPEQVSRFTQQLRERTVEPARIDSMAEMSLPPVGYSHFSIKPSEAAGRSTPLFPPDLAVCPACLSDVTNPDLRYHHYPFTSCTYCGPRYATIRSLPYDRRSTTMDGFPLCETCKREYEDPLNRRFHAQTIACPDCGPQIEVRTPKNARISGDWRLITQQVLRNGGIAAVKGIGGFHLICDATQGEAVQKLRARKHRPRKPLALMARDLETVEIHFDLAPSERAALTDRRAPIVLLKPRPPLREILPLEALAPGHQRLGVMLPYTPLHFLLFSDQLPFLAATSGNQSGFPIARTNAEALTQLGEIADLFVLHDREIAVRVEDSVCQLIDDQLSLIRRSRGYVPETLPYPLPALPGQDAPTVLAVGAEWKNTCCLLHQNQALPSQHIGEIENREQISCWKAAIQHVTGLSGADPHIIAYDPHPGYRVSQEAAQLFAGKDFIPVYHHHAHMAACMAEHGLRTPVIGCILDGTGYGKDGTLWGFEVLVGDYVDFDRLFHLKPFALPGGEAAVRQPWLVAVSLFHELAKSTAQTEAWARECFPQFQTRLPLILAQLDGRIPSPRASSAGRLFDAVAAMLGLCPISTYEGEAAILLGEKAEAGPRDVGSYPIVGTEGEWQTAPLVGELLQDIRRSLPIEAIAQKFHHTVAEMVCSGALAAYQRTGVQSVVLGGGVWNNRYLLSDAKRLLTQKGLCVYTPRRIPAGDGGIAFGQAVSALWRWHRHVSRGSGEGA